MRARLRGAVRRSDRATVGRGPLTAVVLAGLLGAVDASRVVAQETAVDRWLVASADAEIGVNPLAASGPTLFPDRDLVIGPGMWTLVRQDGNSRFNFAELTEPGQATLAHVYLKSPTDADVSLAIEVESCASSRVWLNGQPLEEARGPRDVRLAGGWNTLLAVITGDVDCGRTLSATLSPGRGPVDRDADPVDPSSFRVQASRPPGVRPNFPDGTIAVSVPRVTGLSWRAGQNDLTASVAYDLTSWGLGGALESASDGPAAPPAVDLSGDWHLTLFSPTGIQRLVARLEMDEDGELSGSLRRDPRDLDSRRDNRRGRADQAFEGNIREGSVSGRRFTWKIRTDVLRNRGRVDIEFKGSVENGELRGTIDLSGTRDDVLSQTASRFEAKRVDADEDVEDETTGDVGDAGDASPTPDDGIPEVGAEAIGDDTAGSASPRDPDGQRARMIRQLRGPSPAKAGAPHDGSAEVRLAGESLVAASSGLVAGIATEFDGSLPFQKLRDAALREDGVRVRVRWNGGDRDLSGRVPADWVLRALHGPLKIGGLEESGDGVGRAEFRIPEALAGFTIRGVEGVWWVDGEPAVEGVVCSPCQRGQRIEIGFRGEAGESPRVQISGRGYPDLAGRSGVSAREWLQALDGDNRKYRELIGG